MGPKHLSLVKNNLQYWANFNYLGFSDMLPEVGPSLGYLELKRRPCPEVPKLEGRETKLVVGRETKLLVGRETKLLVGRDTKLLMGWETKLLMGWETKLLMGWETKFWEGAPMVFLGGHSGCKISSGLGN